MPTSARVNDPSAVASDYETETRFLARRLTAWASLDGPLVEDAAISAMASWCAASVLEVGCGTGDVTERVQHELGVPLTAVDLSHRMVQLTAARGVHAIVADIQALPFDGRRFDCVLANRVLYHLPDPDRGLREIARVLRPGGRLVAIGYAAGHGRELYDLLGPRPDTAPDGLDHVVESAFGRVQRNVIAGRAVFASRAAVVGALASWGDYAWFAGKALEACVPEIAVPFIATYRHELVIATRE